MNRDVNNYTWYKVTFALETKGSFYKHNCVEYVSAEHIGYAIQGALDNLQRKIRNSEYDGEFEEFSMHNIISVKEA